MAGFDLDALSYRVDLQFLLALLDRISVITLNSSPSLSALLDRISVVTLSSSPPRSASFVSPFAYYHFSCASFPPLGLLFSFYSP